jgi:hypothetical protein
LESAARAAEDKARKKTRKREEERLAAEHAAAARAAAVMRELRERVERNETTEPEAESEQSGIWQPEGAGDVSAHERPADDVDPTAESDESAAGEPTTESEPDGVGPDEPADPDDASGGTDASDGTETAAVVDGTTPEASTDEPAEERADAPSDHAGGTRPAATTPDDDASDQAEHTDDGTDGSGASLAKESPQHTAGDDTPSAAPETRGHDQATRLPSSREPRPTKRKGRGGPEKPTAHLNNTAVALDDMATTRQLPVTDAGRARNATTSHDGLSAAPARVDPRDTAEMPLYFEPTPDSEMETTAELSLADELLGPWESPRSKRKRGR